ncbi:hypothetical protein ACFXOR_18235 [Streptomyces sp. NPDC059164]|uniref:hypothetical protein n=1 Tax=Streptomyces sp. NPDC059164 TaxID=3346750 RepID=UPI0036C92BAB
MSALYSELMAAEVCETLGLATEPRTVTEGRRPVMENVGVPCSWCHPAKEVPACRTRALGVVFKGQIQSMMEAMVTVAW